MKDYSVYAIWTPNKFSVSNFDNALFVLSYEEGCIFGYVSYLFILMDAFYRV